MSVTNRFSEETSVTSPVHESNVPLVSVGGTTPSNEESSYIPSFLKNISNNDLLIGIGFCVVILAVILLYLYYKNSCQTSPQPLLQPVEQPVNLQNTPQITNSEYYVQPVFKKQETQKVSLVHPRLTEESSEQHNEQHSEHFSEQNSPSEPKGNNKLSQYDLTNSEIGDINEKLKQVVNLSEH